MKYGEVRVEEIVTNQQDVNVGDLIEAQTEYLGNITGRIIQQSYDLNGNIIVKEAVIK